MARKPTYDELEQRVNELEKQVGRLKETEKYRSVVESTEDSIYLVDRDCTYLFVNKRHLSRLGVSQDIIGKSYGEFHSEDDTGEFAMGVEEVVITSEPLQQEHISHKDGKHFLRTLSPVRGPDGKIGAVTVVSKDITRRVEAEEALKVSEKKYRNIFNNAQAGLFRTRISDGKVLECNERFARIHGYENREECIRDLVGSKQYVDPGTRERMVAQLREKGEINDFEARFFRKDGQIVWIRSSLRIYPDMGYLEGIEIDITEAKNAQEALRDSEERYRGIFENSTDFVYTLDLAGNFTEVNKGAERLTGYTNKELVGMNYSDYTPSRDHEKIFNAFHRVFETGVPLQDFPLEVTVKGDRKKYFETSAITLKKGEKIIGFQGVSRDITERVHSEQALRESEEKYRTILESIEDGYYEVDLAGNFTFFNDSFCKIYGYPDDEMMGVNYKRYTDEETAKEVYRVFNGVYTTRRPATGFCWPVVRKDGSKGYIETSVSLITDPEGQTVGFRGIVRDVTERKQMEEELNNTKNFLQNILDNSIDGISTTDLKGEVLYTTPRLKDMIGYEPKEVIGKKISLFYRNGIEDAKEIMRELVAEGEIRNREIQFKKKGGGFVDVILSASLLRDEEGEVTGTLGIFKDISEKKKLEAQLQQTQKMEAIATLAGGVAHQFNNALTSITGHTGLLEMEYPYDEKIVDYAKAMKQSALRMAHLTSQLLAYARGGKYNPRPTALSVFVTDTLPLLEHTLGRGIRIETDLPLDVSNVEVDSTQMQMVLSAILANANEAIEGPGRIRVSTRNIDVDQKLIKDLQGLKPGPYVCLSIEDDGKGMDEETKRRIFDPFFTTHFIGRGLGMASVYGIIRNHDGAITVDSELGKGTVVRIYLPAICPPGPGIGRLGAREGEPGLSAIQRGKTVTEEVVSRPRVEPVTSEGTILVIEDEEDVMMITRETLHRLGYRVLEAKTGSEAVEIARSFDGDIDLALLDIKLPDTSGNKVYPLIMKARPDLKVIVFTGYTIDGPAQNILDAGAEGFIQKPFSVAVLSEKIKVILEVNRR